MSRFFCTLQFQRRAQGAIHSLHALCRAVTVWRSPNWKILCCFPLLQEFNDELKAASAPDEEQPPKLKEGEQPKPPSTGN